MDLQNANQKYVTVKNARFQIEFVNGVEQVSIPAVRNWFVLLFLPFWLTMWTIGGIAAFSELIRTFNLFLVFWLCAWALGWVFAAATLCWQIRGKEIIRVISNDLELGYESFGFSKRWLYRGSEIHELSASTGPSFFERYQAFVPIFSARRSGSVKFRHGARTVFAANSLDEAEGQLIVDFLKKRLPAGVTA